MPATITPALLQLLLTYEELALVLKLVNASTLPGLRSSQVEPRTPEQEMQSLMYAERSLRARELARITPDGQFVVHNALLSAVGVCAYAQEALMLLHIRPDRTLIEFCGSQKDGTVVTYTQPEPGLYQLSVLQDPADLVAQALASCDCQSLPVAQGKTLTVADITLKQAREFAEHGLVREAAALLAADNDATSAATVAELLAAQHALSILMFLRRQPDDTVLTQELTVLHTPQVAWLMTQLPDQATRHLRPISSPELSDVLREHMHSDLALVTGA